MKYVAGTIVGHIVAETRRGGGTLRFVLPSYPSGLLLKIGRELEERFLREPNRRVELRYGIAYQLAKEWACGENNEQADFAEACSRQWYNGDNNLTSLRNIVKPSECDCLVILLAGYEHIDDRGSLQDFFRIDQQALWEVCLKKSFECWVEQALVDYVNLADAKREIEAISSVLATLHEQGLSDVLQTSEFLERQDFSLARTGDVAYRTVLSNLGFFHLPPMPSLASGRLLKQSLSRYIEPAQGFLNYSTFLDETKRRRALSNVSKFRDEIPNEQLDPDLLGSFAVDAHPLEGIANALEQYIANRSEEALANLSTVDFVYLHERILGYRKPNGRDHRRSEPRTKRLAGLPPEIFLHALWISLADFSKSAQMGIGLSVGSITGITIQSTHFRHSFDAVGDDGEYAKRFLTRVLGGIDELIEDQLRLGMEGSETLVEVRSRLSPRSDDTLLTCSQHSSALPVLRFQIAVAGNGHDEPLVRQYEWVLPQYHQSRLLVDLYQWAFDAYKGGGNALPAFALPYMREVFMARDEESVNRMVDIALRKSKSPMVDLLQAEGIDPKDEMAALLTRLSECHQYFISKALESGFFVAMYGERYGQLRVAYTEACNALIRQSSTSAMGPLLMKAFLVVPDSCLKRAGWAWSKECSGVLVTPLHPVLLDMMLNQCTFLFDSFCYYARRGLQTPGGSMFTEKRWQSVVELARIQWPVFGALGDSHLALDTSSASYDYLHLVGRCSDGSSSINSRMLLRDEDTGEEDEIDDIDLFQETNSSQLVRRTLLDFRDLHDYADDGINVGAYCGGDIQPIIAGLDSYLASVMNSRRSRPYSLKLTVFSDSRYNAAFLKWVNAWKELWQEAEPSRAKQHYRDCMISIAYHVVPARHSFEQLRKVLQNDMFDVVFFFDFVRAGASRFEPLGDERPSQSEYRKFPVLEKVCCRVVGGGMDNKRQRVLSNNRFTLSALHAEVMARVQDRHRDPRLRHAVIGTSDFDPWTGVMDVAHNQSAWVVCIDPSVDEQLLKKSCREGGHSREIIGFGTGVGAHGENNYTISTEQFARVDVARKIGSQVSRLFGPMEAQITHRIADSLISEAERLAGLSIVRATGRSEYVRDYMAYAMVRKLLPMDDTAFCDEVISLDAFWHWFDSAGDRKRPDLLRLRARIIDGYFSISAQIIECKLAQHSEGYLEHARQQVENGLVQLATRFLPREGSVPVGISDTMPDQRFWWMQLHRLIASRGKTSREEYMDTLRALERLSDGYFDITWQASAVAFWTDLDTGEMSCSPKWNFVLDDQEMNICVATAGSAFVRRACIDNAKGDLFCNEPGITYRCAKCGEGYAAPVSHWIDRPAAADAGSSASEAKLREDDGTVSACSRAATPLVVSIPSRILLGRGATGGRDVYWEFGHPDLFNRHIVVFGASGTGKTYAIQVLLWELARAGQNSLIVDYTNGFSTGQLEPMVVERLQPVQHTVRLAPLPISPFRRQCDYIDDQPLRETPADVARRVSDLFASVYGLGDQQYSVLYTTIRDGIDDEDVLDLASLIRRLELAQSQPGPIAVSAATLLSKLRPFVDMNPFGVEDKDSWERLFVDEHSRCHIIQLAGFARDSARLITEFSLVDFYWYYRATGNKDRPRVVVLDEIQNLDHRLGSPLSQLLTEGRKFGVSLILATQTMSNLARDERDRLFQASHKLFFKPAATEVRPFAQILADATNMPQNDWIERLSSLKRGECYSLGDSLNERIQKLEVGRSFGIRINSLESRL